MDAALALVCTLPAADLGPRRVDLQKLLARAARLTELDDGVEVEFASTDDIVRTLFDLVLAERHCCSRFTYELSFAPDLGPVTLRVRAHGALRKLVRALFG